MAGERARRVDHVLGALEDFAASARRLELGDLDALREEWRSAPEEIRRRTVWTSHFVLRLLERTPPPGPSDA